jgi:hypothetical protein
MKIRFFQVLLSSAILSAGFYVSQSLSFAKPAYAKKEGVTCTVCHVKAGKKDLNDTGKCYKTNNHTNLKSCEAKQ